ncbi:MAG TPA: type IX secretion system membrane protein PorP/SprF, partial [Draconibacterium sp.]|nr:type IX secretion system membrane protein PorP/SprF [Draconibacterium sp.]
MGKQIRYIIYLFFAMCYGAAFSQDVSFSQFFANPLHLNPAFSGSVGIPRIALQYRNQWHGFNNAFTTY